MLTLFRDLMEVARMVQEKLSRHSKATYARCWRSAALAYFNYARL